MKIFRNIPGAVKVYSNLRYLNGFKREIDDARAKGDQEREMENICYAISTWGDKLSKSLGMDIKVYGKENLPEKGPVERKTFRKKDLWYLCQTIRAMRTSWLFAQP